MAETIGLTTSGATSAVRMSAGANDTKPGYSAGLRVIGTASADFVACKLFVSNLETAKVRYLFDVGSGGVAIATDFLLKGYTNRTTDAFWIYNGGSSGDEIQLNAQTSNITDSFLEVFAILYAATDMPFTPGTAQASYMGPSAGVPALLANTEGFNLDPGPTANTETKFEITTAAGLDFDTDYLTFSFHPKDDVITAVPEWIMKIYTGATGATDSGIAFKAVATSSDVNEGGYYDAIVPRSVFANGTRVWIGIQSQLTNAADRIMMSTMQGYQIAPGGGNGGGRVTNNLLTGLDGR